MKDNKTLQTNFLKGAVIAGRQITEDDHLPTAVEAKVISEVRDDVITFNCEPLTASNQATTNIATDALQKAAEAYATVELNNDECNYYNDLSADYIDTLLGNVPRGISIISNKFKEYFKSTSIFEDKIDNKVSSSITKDVLMRSVSNSIYFSLLKLVGIVWKGNNDFIIPHQYAIDGSVLSSIIYLGELANNNAIRDIDSSKFFELYRHISEDDELIDIYAWHDVFVAEMQSFKQGYPQFVINTFWDEITSLLTSETTQQYCNTQPEGEPFNESVSKIKYTMPINNDDIVIHKPVCCDECDECEECDECDECEDGDDLALSIEIITDEGSRNMVKITYLSEDFGDIAIPIFADINSSSVLDDGVNGVWDFLKYTTPCRIFTTTNPEQFIEYNDEDDIGTKFAVLFVKDELSYVGVYGIADISYICNDDVRTEHVYPVETIGKINKIVSDALSSQLSFADYLINNIETYYIVTEEQFHSEIGLAGLTLNVEVDGLYEDDADNEYKPTEEDIELAMKVRAEWDAALNRANTNKEIDSDEDDGDSIEPEIIIDEVDDPDEITEDTFMFNPVTKQKAKNEE